MLISSLDLKNKSISYKKLLNNYVHCDFSEEEAKEHWKNISQEAKEFAQLMKRDVNISTVITDYFTTTKPLFTEPIIIEENVFRKTEKMALVDCLTNLFNRRYMELALNKELMRSKRYKIPFSICMMDIDNFKHINDTKGHVFGDLVLKNISHEIRKNIREEDIACRYGGEEFLIILPQTDAKGCEEFAERLRKNITTENFFQKNSITYSSGIATFNTEKPDEINSILQRADKALYKAKFRGKNNVCSETI
jgi:diguanylate cyclase (GGDEF)-like protein